MAGSGRKYLCIASIVSMTILVGCGTGSSGSESPSSTESPPSSAESALQPGQVAGVDAPADSIDNAVGQLDKLAQELMESSKIPGMAVAVVHGGDTLYSKGFGVREVGKDAKIDGDTVFQLASLSKSVGSTVIASQVGAGVIDWSTPVVSQLPWFALSDPWVSQNVTVGDFYAHRSGLPEHAGDLLEDLGYDRRQVLERLRDIPLDPFRSTYNYTISASPPQPSPWHKRRARIGRR